MTPVFYYINLEWWLLYWKKKKNPSWCWKQWVEILEACFEDQHGSSNHSQHITNSNLKYTVYMVSLVQTESLSQRRKLFCIIGRHLERKRRKDVKGTCLNMILKVELMRMVLPGGVLGLTLVPTRRVKT